MSPKHLFGLAAFQFLVSTTLHAQPSEAPQPESAPASALSEATPPAAPAPAPTTSIAPSPADAPPTAAVTPASPHWYELLKVRGYTQLRYNGLPTFQDNDNLVNAQGDKYIGAGSTFAIRRARVILYGDVHERVSVYLQTDFASAIGDQNHVAIVRDWYTDVYIDPAKELRLRLGQSKVPFGFENMQSSQNRLPLDRNDALNSAVKDERDLGVFAYWAPAAKRKLLKSLVDDNLKGSGDYGVVALGMYNGQTANRFDNNDNFHVVGRISYPFEIGNQVLEIGGGGYTGLYTIKLADEKDQKYTTPDRDNNLRDARAYGSIILYPKPLGIVVEYNGGVGPQQAVSEPGVIKTRKLYGGYAQLFYKVEDLLGTVSLIPYVRGTYYNGGKKFENNAPYYRVRELELGLEWQLLKALEVTVAYAFADRTSSKYPYAREKGHLGRVQVQFNY
ncbi:MAG: hypothetical protein RL701_4445 [Pseudomonadota bacterium]